MTELKVGRFTVAVVPVDRLDLLEKNARYMRNETFRRLVANVQKDGQLSQFPFCVVTERDAEGRPARFRVLSGNHRVKAAREAGLSEVPIIYTDEELSRQEQVAIQLSHNAIVGEDDPQILKELWAELTEVSAKLYSGLDDKTLALLANVKVPALSEVRLDFRTVTFLFLPNEIDEVQQAFDAAKAVAKGDVTYLARMSEYDALLDKLATASAAYNVRNAATAVLCLLAVLNRHVTELAEGWYDEATGEIRQKGWVPLETVLGTSTVPAESAAVVKRAVEKMRDAGDVDSKALWKALEYWAADYLAGE